MYRSWYYLCDNLSPAREPYYCNYPLFTSNPPQSHYWPPINMSLKTWQLLIHIIYTSAANQQINQPSNHSDSNLLTNKAHNQLRYNSTNTLCHLFQKLFRILKLIVLCLGWMLFVYERMGLKLICDIKKKVTVFFYLMSLRQYRVHSEFMNWIAV